MNREAFFRYGKQFALGGIVSTLTTVLLILTYGQWAHLFLLWDWGFPVDRPFHQLIELLLWGVPLLFVTGGFHFLWIQRPTHPEVKAFLIKSCISGIRFTLLVFLFMLLVGFVMSGEMASFRAFRLLSIMIVGGSVFGFINGALVLRSTVREKNGADYAWKAPLEWSYLWRGGVAAILTGLLYAVSLSMLFATPHWGWSYLLIQTGKIPLFFLLGAFHMFVVGLKDIHPTFSFVRRNLILGLFVTLFITIPTLFERNHPWNIWMDRTAWAIYPTAYFDYLLEWIFCTAGGSFLLGLINGWLYGTLRKRHEPAGPE